MASRPFATINVALETDEEPPDLIGGNVKVGALNFLEVASLLPLIDIANRVPRAIVHYFRPLR